MVSAVEERGNGWKPSSNIVDMALDDKNKILYLSDERRIYAVAIENGDRYLASGSRPFLETAVETQPVDVPISMGPSGTSSSTSSNSSSFFKFKQFKFVVK